MTSAALFATTMVTLFASHSVADHWFQTNFQAITKGKQSRAGQLADLRHVTTYTATLAVALLVVAWRLDLSYDPVRLVVGLLVNAASHYWADRRVYLISLARRIGKGGWIDNDPSAGYQLDQSWHLGWLLVTGLIIV